MRALWMMIVTSIWITGAAAHDVQPAIADIETSGSVITFTVTLNGEALAAGVSLEGVENTDSLDDPAAVDRLRALDPAALRADLTPKLPAFLGSLAMRTDAGSVTLGVTSVDVDEIGNVELPRETVIRAQGSLPEGATTLELDWPSAYGALVLRQQGVEEPYTGYLDAGQSSGPIALAGSGAPGGWATFGTYIPVGFDHILPKGLDHILFVLGLVFLSARFAPLLWQVTAFTLAHSVTLAMAVLGIVTVPGSIVEPLIAASITFVAVENILSDKLNRWRPFVIFGFGLLHGLGFASVLGSFGLPEGQVIPALIGFNIGVELGQLTVIAVVFLIVWHALKVDRGAASTKSAQALYGAFAAIFVAFGFLMNTTSFQDVMGASSMVFFWPLAVLCVLCILSATFVDQLGAYRRFVAIPASAAIALVGAYWFVERVFF